VVNGVVFDGANNSIAYTTVSLDYVVTAAGSFEDFHGAQKHD
jgi:hypothetical protein